MLFAHLPAGYLIADRMSMGRTNRRVLMATGLVASVLPDFDMFWFHFVNGRQNVHHEFLFHWPLFWMALAVIAWPFRSRLPKGIIPVALASVMLHLLLDSIAGHIMWLAPFSDWTLNLVEVPARYDWWVWSFMTHWVFAAELAIIFAAAVTFLRRK